MHKNLVCRMYGLCQRHFRFAGLIQTVLFDCLQYTHAGMIQHVVYNLAAIYKNVWLH